MLRERNGEGKGEREQKHGCERETVISCLSYVPQLGIEPSTQSCAGTGNLTGNLSVHKMTDTQLSHSSRPAGQYLIHFNSNFNFLLFNHSLTFFYQVGTSLEFLLPAHPNRSTNAFSLSVCSALCEAARGVRKRSLPSRSFHHRLLEVQSQPGLGFFKNPQNTMLR